MLLVFQGCINIKNTVGIINFQKSVILFQNDVNAFQPQAGTVTTAAGVKTSLRQGRPLR